MDKKLLNDSELLRWAIQNPKLKKSFNKLLSSHYKREFTVLNLLLSSLKNDHKMKFYILHNNKEVIALARYKYGKQVKISSVIVNPKHRRKNICTKMIGQLLKIVEAHKQDIILEVKKDNIGAIKCYQKNGFEEIGENKYGEIIMKKN